jgi:uncharacterized RDD family membrane protein YckC
MDANPYQPPAARLIDESPVRAVESAERGQRFWAAMLDWLLSLAYLFPIAYLLGSFDYVRNRQELPPVVMTQTVLLGFVGFALMHGYFLKNAGQTIGKKILGIRIVDMQGDVPSLARTLGLRYFILQVSALLPLVGKASRTIDAVFIFRENRRCLHDLIAGTQVVKIRKADSNA